MSNTAKVVAMPSPSLSVEDIIEEKVKASVERNVSNSKLEEIIKKEIDSRPPFKFDIKVVGERKQSKEFEGYMRPELKAVMTLSQNRINVLMVGPAGCGKTHMAKQVAEFMDLEYGSINCSAGMSETHLTGWLIPTGEGGKFVYTPSMFVDIYENGGVFLFDEIDAADSNTLLFINQALGNGEFYVPQRVGNPKVVKHKDAIIMAAANTYGTGGNLSYSGRERLDEATLDRFRSGVVPVSYDETLEEQFVDPSLLHWARITRSKINSSKLSRVLSTRFLVDATKLLEVGYDPETVKKIFFTGWSTDEMAKVR